MIHSHLSGYYATTGVTGGGGGPATAGSVQVMTLGG